MAILIIIGITIFIVAVALIILLNYSYRDIWRRENAAFKVPEWNEYDTYKYEEEEVR